MAGKHACIDCSFFLFCNTILCFTLVVFVVWTIFLPDQPKFSISDASLTQFNFTNTNTTLQYHLEINITIRNQNSMVDIYYNNIQVIANYGKQRFAVLTLDSTPFHQGNKNTTNLNNVVLEGQQLVKFEDTELSQLYTENAAGLYSIKVQLAIRAEVGYDIFKTRYYQRSESKIDCKLKIPSSFQESSSRHFKTTKCGNVYIVSDPVI